MLRLRSYRKEYDGQLLLSVDLLELPPALYWLQAPNGAGKSTLLRSLAGLIPFEGSISVNDIELRRDRQRYTQLVSWAEAEPLYPAFLTGNDLLHFYRATRGGTEQQEAALLAAFDAGSYRAGAIGTWSSGMAKKLSLVLAFLGNPQWLLLDEPFITLDVAAQAALRELIRAHLRQGGGVLLTSHQEPGLGDCTLLRIGDKTIQR